MTGRAAVLVAGLVLAAVSPTAAVAIQARASLTDVEDEVMCLVCHTPLAVSQSPQADAERQFIRGLIAQGDTKAQVKDALVAQYGPAVLALPKPRGFNLTIYILPPALLLAGLGALVVTLPRWRRRTRARTAELATATPTLDPADARRVEEELARYE
jgi:cytochrome c-type biogenesis protein CcmH/NrfF